MFQSLKGYSDNRITASSDLHQLEEGELAKVVIHQTPIVTGSDGEITFKLPEQMTPTHDLDTDDTLPCSAIKLKRDGKNELSQSGSEGQREVRLISEEKLERRQRHNESTRSSKVEERRDHSKVRKRLSLSTHKTSKEAITAVPESPLASVATPKATTSSTLPTSISSNTDLPLSETLQQVMNVMRLYCYEI